MGDEREIRRLAACNETAMETTVKLSHRTRRERDTTACRLQRERERGAAGERRQRGVRERGTRQGHRRLESGEGRGQYV
ncbi:hypothetical protein FH972_007329 [Carpinus fangiana]|uniref:Uncharacterized protein n=1 Tax=Carpinus fangiana TaxID=176857 RepID=A0A5N6QV87_9ROSI|nr:hypothetical protein FH972_007329 [Carpinus fangiana]